MNSYSQTLNPSQTGRVILRDRTGAAGDRWLSFRHSQQILETFNHAEVADLLSEVEAAVQHGLFAAGYLSYEAAPAFDPALRVHPARKGLPLAWFGLFKTLDEFDPNVSIPNNGSNPAPISWEPTVSAAAYHRSLIRILDWISRGETYQINYTHQLESAFEGDAWGVFTDLFAQQRSGYHAFIDTGDHVICSASPELFFSLEGNTVLCRPMKGTAARGRTLLEDSQQAELLRNSPKERAENVMIVDMIRNDLGQIAVPGSVTTTSLFDIEKYETLHQMTSTVVAETTGSISDIFRALFPCASITGAPKIRATELIRELEDSPRGIYTGAIGFLLPGRSGRRAQFNVAIRTIHLDRQRCSAHFGTGSGVVWDSDPASEFRECATKTLLLGEPEPEFSLLETMLWTPARGIRLRSRHLSRLSESASYFDFEFDLSKIEGELERVISGLHVEPVRLRLTLDRLGGITITAENQDSSRKIWRVGWAREPIDSTSRFLFHKTTSRALYNRALDDHPNCDDVLLWNERREITESCRANLVVRRQGRLLTPPLSSGLLPGTLRAELLHRNRIHEQPIFMRDVVSAEGIYLINSVRGCVRVEIDPLTQGNPPAD